MAEDIFITKENFFEFTKNAQSVALVMIYALSKYHEKYRVTQWCMEILNQRGFRKEDMGDFDTNFINFFDQMLKQDDL